MNLIVDIGNSFIKLAVMTSEEKILFHKRFGKVKVSDIIELNKRHKFEGVIISSVRKTDPYFVKYLNKKYNSLVLSHKTKVPVTNNYGTPKTLGLDRLAAVIGAHCKYPKKNCLVIDIGTCMTYDYITAQGTYEGGNIAPGVELRLKSMHHFTSALPLISRQKHNEMLGSSTQMAMQNGAVWGVKLEIEGFIKTLTKKKGKVAVILTGGDAEYFGEIIDSKIFVQPYLLLFGLNQILKYNQS